jgi:flagellar M-ring protein FliF
VNERLQAALKQFVEFWKSLSIAKRVSMVVATAAVLVGVIAAASLGSRVDYTYLFTELSTEDAAAISEKLKAMKVPYKIEAGGTAIQVPEERVHQLRLELASAGLPRGGGVGFEIFDRSNLGATEFDQRVNLRRALEGELSRSISTIEGVQSARVHLVLPENRLFAARKESASASVVLKLRNGRDFGRREVAGIVHLVSAAVPGLSHDRVSVVSTEGVTLHRPSPTEGGGTSSDNETEQAREIAGGMESQVRTLIERVVGPGNSDVRVNVDLNTASRERMEEHYEPTRTALRSEHKTEESDGTEGATVAGVPGAQSNLPHTDVTENTKEGGGPGGNVFRKTQTRNWEVDRTTEKTTMPAGGIARLSVAVLVDGSYNKANGKPAFVPRTPAQIAQIDAIVKNAVGFDEKRGDSVRVEAAQFARLDEEPEAPPAGLLGFAKKSPVAAAAIVGAFLMLAGLSVFAVSRSRKAKKALEAAKAAPQLEAPAHLAALAQGEDGPPSLAELEAPANAADLRAEALLIAAKDPATAAIVLKKWLNSQSSPAAAA